MRTAGRRRRQDAAGLGARAGPPRPLTNVPVFDRAGRHIGTPDLLDPERGGRASTTGRSPRGRQRGGTYAVRTHSVTWDSSTSRSSPPTRDRASSRGCARATRAGSGAERPAWTLEPPAWWARPDRRPAARLGRARAVTGSPARQVSVSVVRDVRPRDRRWPRNVTDGGSSGEEGVEDAEADGGGDAGGGEGEDPGGHDRAGHAPADGGDAAGGAGPMIAEVMMWVVEIGACQTNAVA